MLLCGAALGLCLSGARCEAAGQAAGDKPDVSIPLAPLGYQVAPAHILLTSGYVVSSVNYVDAHHILLTFNDRKLIHRQADDSSEEHPQIVDAVLLEAPSGKVVARTEWRLHDHEKYLWQLGQGVLLLRLGREMRLLTPLTDAPERALSGRLLLTLPGQMSYAQMSPDGRIAVLEAEVETGGGQRAPASADAVKSVEEVTQHSTDLQFLEFDLTQAAQGKVEVRRLAHSTIPSPMGFALLREGYMTAQQMFQYPDDWNLVYRRMNGSEAALGDVVSTCRPTMEFLSNREMYVVTCNGSETSLMITVVTLDKQELWQQGLQGDGSEYVVRSAPDSGRYVVSHILSDGAAGMDLLLESMVHGQRIEVHDIKNGALVAGVDAVPVERAAENFALSADGRQLAVLQNDTLALYNLAPMQDFPAQKIKPKDLIFVAAKETAPAEKSTAAAAPVAIVAPFNVDARRTRPTLYTPEEQKAREKKQGIAPPDKQDTAQP